MKGLKIILIKTLTLWCLFYCLCFTTVKSESTIFLFQLLHKQEIVDLFSYQIHTSMIFYH
uniref:Uncharacterized protein n=1 Tax=Octopus bimaculoides TaxID=37653 RepID=A0A0L8H1H7_OCTBM